jgi:hypothetical protein
MKKNLFYIIIILSFFSLTSCTYILLSVKGLKYPRYETIEYLDHTAMKFNIDTSLCLYTKDSTAFLNLYNKLNNNPGVIIFSDNDYRNLYTDKNNACPAPISVLLSNLCSTIPVAKDSSTKESAIAESLYYRNGKKFKKEELKNPYRVYFIWAVWHNRKIEELKQWEALVKSLKDCKYDIRWINADFMADQFGIAKRKKIELSTSISK